MAGLVSSVGLVVMLKVLVQRMLFLGITVLVTVIASDSPVADGYQLDSHSTPMGFLGNNTSPTRSSPSALLELHQAAFQKPESTVSLLSTSEPIQTSSPSPESSRQLHQASTSITTSSLSAFTGSTPHQGPHYEGKVTSSQSQKGTLEQMQPNTTPTPGQTFSENLTNNYLSPIVNSSQLSPNPDEIISPGYLVPSITPHSTLSLPEPAEVPSDDFYPTNTMDVDWGSGDYLETISYLDQDRDDASLVTKVPSDPYDLEENTETYDTSFPSRVGISPSSLHPVYLSPSSSFMTAHNTIVPHTSIHPSSFSVTAHLILPTPHTDTSSTSDVDWGDTFTIQPTDVLLPDMNSLEYYTTQLTKESNVSAEHKTNITRVAINATNITPTSGFTSNLTDDESSGDLSGFEPPDESTTVGPTEENLQLINATKPLRDPSLIPTHFLNPSSSIWNDQLSTTGWSVHTLTEDVDTAITDSLQPGTTPLLPEDLASSSSLTDVHWFVTDAFDDESVHVTTVVTETTAFSSVPTEPAASDPAVTEEPFNNASVSTNSTSPSVTPVSPVMLGDRGITDDGADISTTMALIPESSDVNTVSALPTSQPGTTNAHHTTTETSTVNSVITTMADETTMPRPYLCNVERPAYLTRMGFPPGVTVGHAKSQVRDVLKREFNKSVELQVVNPPPSFEFRVVSGPIVYTAISVINALLRYERNFLNVTPNWVIPDSKYQVQTVLQFVPGYIDVRFCNFSESLEKGLTLAFAEVRRRSGESTNFTVHIIDITTAVPKYENWQLIRQPVDIIFTISGSRGFLTGSEVSDALLKLTVVEFSYYIGFPVLQIAEPLHYPELNTSSLLRSSWVRTVLLGVLEQKQSERTFQANIERQVAVLLAEAMGQTRRVKRATTVGNNSVQIVNMSRLEAADHPLEIMYFVEGPNGERVPAVQTADLLNRLDLQRAAIILGFRVQGVLAQPVEKVENNNNMWIIVGAVMLLFVVLVVISVLYWKLCRTDKLEFQPDAMSAIQQRQKLQAPSVKGFDFAKLHLGQHNKDDVMVIQEPVPMGSGSGPLPVSAKDGIAPSENGDAPTTKSRTSASSTKASRSSRRRERISPSDGDSVVSDRSSERESTEENLRAHATPSDSKHTRKAPINVLNGKNRIGPPPAGGAALEPPTAAAMFEHVDRMSRPTDASRRLPNKIQLIAMQPMPVPPLQGPAANGKLSDTNQMNKEIQAALRHKSEIEHHRNKIRLRAKRKGHYDFPAMDDMISGLGDAKDQDHIYQKAQNQINRILDADSQVPPVFMEFKKSGRGRRSPKPKRRDQMNGGMMEADKDHLITEDSDAACRKCPGVNNVAYVSDPDQGPGSPQRSPSPTDDVFLGPASSPPGHAPPPLPYMPPQPSIEEARQQMHSLLDDAFALVSPTSQSSAAGITLPGVNSNVQGSSPPDHGRRAWGPSYQALGPPPAVSRFSDLGMSSATGLTPRQDLGLSLLPPAESAGRCESLQPDSLYSSRGLYTDDVPSSARPRPVGSTTGAQLHHLTQVGLSSRVNGYPAGIRTAPGQNGGLGWNHYHDSNFSRIEAEKDAMHRSGTREPTAPPSHLDAAGVAYLTAPQPLGTPPPTQSSASLIKAIREELLRLSQKQAAVSSYHS
uniref:KIAA1549 n=1 Tax=Nothobranchius kuhntae TaxID=321403 RepID=A0A1A8IAI0_NOTKU